MDKFVIRVVRNTEVQVDNSFLPGVANGEEIQSENGHSRERVEESLISEKSVSSSLIHEKKTGKSSSAYG